MIGFKSPLQTGTVVALCVMSLGADCGGPEPYVSSTSSSPPTDVCESSHLDGLAICPLDADFPYGEDLEGMFEAWKVGTIQFFTLTGESYTLDIQGDPFNLFGLPNLADHPSIGLRIEGDCDNAADEDELVREAQQIWGGDV